MHIIFDFDGTLVDSYHCVLEKCLLLAEEFKLRKIQQDEIPTLRDLSSEQLIKYLQVPLHKIPKLILAIRKHLCSEMQKLKPVEGIPAVIEKLHHSGFSLGILTSNSNENVTTWLEQNKLHPFFNFIKTESKFFSKKNVLSKILKSNQMDKTKTFYIGDETRDVEAAKKTGVKSIAVTWGYNSEKALLQYQPDFIAQEPKNILETLEPLSR